MKVENHISEAHGALMLELRKIAKRRKHSK